MKLLAGHSRYESILDRSLFSVLAFMYDQALFERLAEVDAVELQAVWVLEGNYTLMGFFYELEVLIGCKQTPLKGTRRSVSFCSSIGRSG